MDIQRTPEWAATIGQHLLQVRRFSGLPLEKVAEVTNINISVLRALEIDDRDNLPAQVYVRAFYKKYADFLGLNGEEVLHH